MNVIQWNQFADRVNAFNAEQAAARLCGLARWWLSPAALELAGVGESAARLADLPADSGDCWVLCVNGREQTYRHNQEPGLLRSEFLLPLTWVEGAGHGCNLPPDLKRWAQHVAATLTREIPELAGRTWGLRLYTDPDSRQVDLSHLDDFAADSAWATLAAALWCKATNSLPDRHVWATGCWRTTAQGEKGIWRVQEDTLPRKIRLFQEYGARQLFVPLSQVDDAREFLGAFTPQDGDRIGTLGISEPKVLRALGGYLAALKAEPGADASFPARRDHYLAIQPLNPSRARSFRERRLFGEIVARCREHFQTVQRRLGVGRQPLLITIASVNPELIPLAVEATQAAACLIFYDRGADTDGVGSFLKEAEEARRLIAQHRLPCRQQACVVPDPLPFSFDDTMDETFRRAVNDLRRSNSGRPLIFDLTPATKLMTSAMAQYVAQPGDWLFYLTHVWRKDLRIQDPGTERPLLWPVGQKWDFGQLAWQ